MGLISLRLATAADAEQIREIYNYEVQNTTATFDLVPRTLADQQQWLAERSGAFATIVAVATDAPPDTPTIVGFGALSPYKERAAYRTSVENSVYVRRGRHGEGIGRLLLTELLATASRSGFHTVFARINAASEASVALHRACGYEPVGIEREVGRKFGRWHDVALMQRLL
ncbi:MAG: GNAT family N-acetyltransferase [Actinomycetia bacterium]|nr:GNAT family N-acetyltransferase [Actinomycetes bacterium]